MITGAGLAAIGELSRFASAPDFMAYRPGAIGALLWAKAPHRRHYQGR
jgi:hypothetical protein